MSTSSPSTWHSVNPQTRPLTLSILELTPLALTLSLTLAPLGSTPTPGPSSSSQNHPHTPTAHIAHTHNHAHGPKSRKKPRHKAHSDDEEDDEHVGAFAGVLDSSTNFKDLLSHGVVVSVNGQPWNRIVAHVSDPEEHEPEVEGDDEEDEEWEDEPASASATAGQAEEGENGMVKRRPRKARFGSAATNAVRGEEKGVTRRKKAGEAGKEKRVDRDRAVVVVYGLSPGREYEIELQVVGLSGPEADPLVSNSVLIPPSPSPLGAGHPRSRANSLRSRSRPRSRSNSLSAPSGSHPSSANHSNDSSIGASPGRVTPPVSDAPMAIPTNILNPIDTQAAQIRHMIAAAHAEKEHVQSQIKEARRASQRAEAALRLEIETVKKATEKAGSLDLRAKQKTLALQEQVKQAWAGSEAADKEASEVEAGLAELEGRLEEVRAEVEGAKEEHKQAKDKEEEVRDREKKNRAEEEKKLQEVVGKIEKLRVKKEKKEGEKLELEKRLRELVTKAEDIEKKNEDVQTAKKSGAAYWWDPYTAHGHGHHGNHGHGHDRTLTNHPSLNNLSAHGGFAHRGRGFAGRYPSAGSARPAASAASPTHQTGFYPLQHPPNPATTSPAFRPPKVNPASPGPARASSSSGVNVAAMPFHPSNYPPVAGSSGNAAANANAGDNHHTTLMPPQLQHRIYLPNAHNAHSSVRPRPQPNFNPPPSVLAERQSPTLLSTPSFPPLPGTAPGSTPSKTAAGPSLASIVTRAVLSPTGLASQAAHAAGSKSPPATTASPGTGGSGSTSTPTPPIPGRAVTFGPPPERSGSEGFSVSPSGPWSGLGAIGAGVTRTSTPPTMGPGAIGHRGRESPASSLGSGPGGQAGSRKNTE